MAEALKLPRMSDTMEEGVIAEINIKKGDKLKTGDVIAEVETDKATMEWESFQEGVVLHVAVGKGDAVPVNALVAVIGEEGEDPQPIIDAEASGGGNDKEESKEEETKQEEKKEEKKEASASSAKSSDSASSSTTTAAAAPSSNGSNGRIKASPLAKKIAEEKGIDISLIQGSGDDGRIVKKDVEDFAESGGGTAMQQPTVVAGEEGHEELKVSQMRKTIAKRLAESKFGAPHFYLTMEIEMDRTMEARSLINKTGESKVSFNDIIIRAVAAALRKHPAVNSSWHGDTIRRYKHVHIGMAVAVDEGLVVPVIKHADQKGLVAISQEAKYFAERARSKKIQPEEMEGGTFAISNLGMFGIEEFTAIINPPNACILAVGGIKEVPAIVDGQLKNKHVMKVTLSCDHRVVDGASGSQFLQTLKQMLENPLAIVI